VASGNRGMNLHLSEIVSQILEPVANSMKGSVEIISCEEMKSKFDKLNERNKNWLEEGADTGSVEEGAGTNSGDTSTHYCPGSEELEEGEIPPLCTCEVDEGVAEVTSEADEGVARILVGGDTTPRLCGNERDTTKVLVGTADAKKSSMLEMDKGVAIDMVGGVDPNPKGRYTATNLVGGREDTTKSLGGMADVKNSIGSECTLVEESNLTEDADTSGLMESDISSVRNLRVKRMKDSRRMLVESRRNTSTKDNMWQEEWTDMGLDETMDEMM
jgi:hypothetical protein